MSDVSSDPRTGLTSFRRFMWWTLLGAIEVSLVLAVGEWVAGPDPPIWARAGGAVALVVTVVTSAVLLARRLVLDGGPDPGGRATSGGVPGAGGGRLPLAWLSVGGVAAAVLGAVLLVDGKYGLWAYAPATVVSIAATFLPARPRWLLVAGAAAGGSAVGGTVALAADDGLVAAVVAPAGLVAVIAWYTLGMLWAWDVAARLTEARRLAAELAVKDERLRFAADLHDIQGHHLQVIALKSELAARLVERDPARAAGEMEEVQRLATQALQDTRAVVQGYRRTTLDDEIANATRVLAAADIDARMNVAGPVEAADDGARHLLGLVMREATTNVLRHSRAQQADVDYRVTGGCAHLRVSNDGAAAGSGSEGRRLDSGGTGLRSLSERLEAAGGELSWRHDGDRFVVEASLPVMAPTLAPASGEAG